MRKGLITSILALTFTGLQAQPHPGSPKLVVTLTIDQLRTDYMEAFSSLYSEKGFKRLMREGKVYTQAEYPFCGTDRSSAIATLYTGTTPSINGIIAENWLSRETLRPVNSMDDPAFMGNYTHESSSPAALLTSTFADELKIATRNKGIVYAVAPFRDAALIGAGHAGNGAFWLNEYTGKWCSTTYYEEFPWWLSQYNERQSPDFRIKEMIWTPSLPVSSYSFLPEGRTEPFKHKPDSDKTNKYRRLITTPFINEEINRLVGELLSKSTIGQDEVTDLLSLTYYAGNYNHMGTQECAMEVQDAYVRLDKSIASLLELLELKVGLENTLLCIASTGYTDPEKPDQELYRIPGGEFHMNRCTTLLNMFLMASYGEGQYVEASYNRHIYLNHKLIERKQLSLTEIQQKSAEFLAQFSGVAEVHYANDLLIGSWSPQKELVRKSFHPKRSGDLLINILPGWTIVYENSSDNHIVRSAHIPAPLILLGSGIRPTVVRTPVSMECVAPTLSGIMHIRAPNGCAATALDLR
ncbi:MAG: alkaline phosphatase family protein [Bacteroides sp.]|nr:alkaline phosphatase family protein [Bacteroides sp.]